jgi:hypothetical protein
MPSELKSETSRANGAKSHGPKTPEGKEASSRNSLKHGLTSRSTILLQCESLDEYKEFLAEHIAIHQPVTPPEKELVEQMAIARWRIRRFVGAETVLIDCEMVRNRDKVEKEFAPIESDVHLAMAIRSLADESRCLSLMSRYESRLQRVHDKAYTALRELQQSPANSPSVSEGDTTPTPPEPDPPPAADQHPKSNIRPANLRNEPDAPPPSSPDIHLCTPVRQVPDLPGAPPSGSSEDHDA